MDYDEPEEPAVFSPIEEENYSKGDDYPAQGDRPEDQNDNTDDFPANFAEAVDSVGGKRSHFFGRRKNRIISTLSTVHSSFPMGLWDELLPQVELTMNCMRSFGPDPSVSAYEGTHREPFDFRKHPIAPFGTQVLIYESPTQRSSWSPHGVTGFYLGPALDHYRSFRVYPTNTGVIRTTDTLSWFPAPFKIPGSSALELLHAAIDGLAKAIRTLQYSRRRK